MLKFEKIQFEDVFGENFKDMKSDNHLKLKKSFTILYGPNGTGKSTLTNLLSEYPNNPEKLQVKITNPQFKKFFVIGDHGERHVIEGEPSEYLLGNNIRREKELEKLIESESQKLLGQLRSILKNDYALSTISHKLISYFASEKQEFIQILVNKQRNELPLEQIFAHYVTGTHIEQVAYDLDRAEYIGKNIQLLDQILKISNLNKPQPTIAKYEQNQFAITAAKKFPHETCCIVCDAEGYNANTIEKNKNQCCQNILSQLSGEEKKLLEIVMDKLDESNDYFQIKPAYLQAIEHGDITFLQRVQETIKQAIAETILEIDNMIASQLQETNLHLNWQEHQTLLANEFVIEAHDEMLLTEVISELIGKTITAERNDKNSIILKLDQQELIGTAMKELHLSTGQRNFISLAFEMIRAKNINTNKEQIIVIDDPISSYDSIYKNKIIYCMASFLKDFKIIILTHNIDTLRLLHFQCKDIELYLYNTKSEQRNGFIPVANHEVEYLLNMRTLLEYFKSESFFEKIPNKEIFFTALIPFMRGYANICCNTESYQELSKVMHGYETTEINLAAIFNQVILQHEKQSEPLMINVAKLIRIANEFDGSKSKIIENAPLLNKTLLHSLKYLAIRLQVEHVLISQYQLEKNLQNKRYPAVTDIINWSFPEKEKTKRKNRIFFMSKKTLMNEFNHYEGNLNIFEPAIDITDEALEKEVKSIGEKLLEIQCEQNEG